MKARAVLPWLLFVLAAGLLARMYFTDDAEVERLKADVGRMSRVAHEQAGRTQDVLRRERRRMDSLAVVAESADTVFRAAADTLRLQVPDSLRRHVNTLVEADSAKLQACEGRVRSCLTMLAETEEERDHWRELAAKRDTLVGELDTSPLEWALDRFGLGVTCGLTSDVRPGCAVGVTFSL